MNGRKLYNNIFIHIEEFNKIKKYIILRVNVVVTKRKLYLDLISSHPSLSSHYLNTLTVLMYNNIYSVLRSFKKKT